MLAAHQFVGTSGVQQNAGVPKFLLSLQCPSPSRPHGVLRRGPPAPPHWKPTHHNCSAPMVVRGGGQHMGLGAVQVSDAPLYSFPQNSLGHLHPTPELSH